jgi:hypothetical protein
MKEKLEQAINEAYEHYQKTHEYEPFVMGDEINLSKDEFIKKATNNHGFGFLFGISISERELNLEERLDLLKKLEIFQEHVIDNAKSEMIHSLADSHSIPTKLITVNYKNEKIEVYK